MRIACFIFLVTGYIFILYLYLRKWLGSHLRQITSITFLFLLPYQNPDYNQLHSYSSLCFNCFRFVREVNELCWCGWLILLTITFHYYFIIFKRLFNFKLDYTYSAKIQIQLHLRGTIFLYQIIRKWLVSLALILLLNIYWDDRMVGPPKLEYTMSYLSFELRRKTTYL